MAMPFSENHTKKKTKQYSAINKKIHPSACDMGNNKGAITLTKISDAINLIIY
jgi:hypothetical protein